MQTKCSVLDHKQTFGLSRYSILSFYPSESYFTSFYTSTQVAYVWSDVTQWSGIRAHEGNSWLPLVITVYGLKT
jgi:hypothetical protein